MSIVSNPYTFSITSNKTFKTATLAPSIPGTRLGPYRYRLDFWTDSNDHCKEIDNISSKYLSVEYGCSAVDEENAEWWYTLYLVNGTTETDYGYFNHLRNGETPRCSLTKIS